jgi:RND family efflux transporter MFP subunit
LPLAALLAFTPLALAAPAADQPLGCLIQPDQVAELGSPVIGLLRQVHVERGDSVRKGQILATLSADVEQASLGVARTRAEADADVRAAQADFDYNRQRLARAEDLRRQNFISEQALEQSRAEAEIARQKLAQAQEQRRVWAREFDLAQSQVAQRVIRSPFNGVVVERYRYPGERVEEKPILKLASLDPLRVEVFMPASRYGQIKPGMVLAVSPELPGTEAYEAKVARVDRIIDPASNTFRVQLRLPNPKQALPAGLRCKVVLGDDKLREASAKAPARVR